MLCSPAMQKGLLSNAFQTSAAFCLSLSWKGQPCSCMSECRSVLYYTVYCCAVLGELVTSQEWIPLSWRGRSPVFCSLDLADTVLTDLRTGRMIDFWD